MKTNQNKSLKEETKETIIADFLSESMEKILRKNKDSLRLEAVDSTPEDHCVYENAIKEVIKQSLFYKI
jgi:hypothetical protein